MTHIHQEGSEPSFVSFLSFSLELAIEFPSQDSAIKGTSPYREETLHATARRSILRQSRRFGEERLPEFLDFLVVSL